MSKVNWKAVFKVFAWIVSIAGITVLMSFIGIKRQGMKCTKVQILIPGADNFVEREEIDAILRESEGELVGRNLEQINIQHIENAIKRNPYIAYVKVFNDMDGVINIEINQREPILRVLNAGGQDYYVDSKGLKMPMSPNFTANVLVATGNILEGFSGRVDTLLTRLGKDLYKVALYSKKDSLWDAQFEQMYVNEKKDIELVPRVGNQRIILGNADSLENKLENLLAFYKQGMPLVGWNAYKTINLKYHNQVVCERYDSLELKRPKPITIDTAAVQKQAVSEVVQSAIQDEIKAAIKNEVAKQKSATAEAVKPKEEKISTTEKKKEAVVKPAEKEKPKTEAKKATVDNKKTTDTKKNKGQ